MLIEIFLFIITFFSYTFITAQATGANTIAELRKEINALKQKKADSDNQKNKTQIPSC